MHKSNRRRLFLLAALLTAGVPLLAAGPAAAGEAAVPAVREIRNLAYYDGEGADPVRHKLNLYLPHGRENFPVMVLVHGGAWLVGDRGFFGWGDDLGRHFARQGIGVVMPSYRLSPGVRHPEHARDVARAVAWAAANMPELGGAADGMILAGHSAGGHLVSLLASDPKFLRDAGVDPSRVKGVVSVSGVYRIPEIDLAITLPEGSMKAIQAITSLFAPRPGKKANPVKAKAAEPVQVRLPFNLFEMAFGKDRKAWQAASPINHVRCGLPPFLLINADRDWPLLPEMARDFAKALRDVGTPVETLTVKDRNHENVMFRATTPDDPTARAIEGFVRKHTARQNGR
jgi:acetyl esterase/lipase